LLSNLKNHALFSIGFRPFFILTALQAIIVPTIWISVYKGISTFQGRFFSPAAWHSHEMIFGFTLALICGFLLTASANWTGKKPIKGIPLIVLSTFWILERVLLLLPTKSWLVVPFSQLFLIYFIYLIFQMLKDNKKNLKVFLPILLTFLFAKTLMLLAPVVGKHQFLVWSREIGLGLIQLIILVVAGRILPFFTTSKHPELKISKNKIIEVLAIAPCIFLIIPREFFNEYLFFALYIVAAVFNTCRLLQYKPFHTIKNQMLFILNTGYLWIIFSLILHALTVFYPSINFSLTPLHAFAMGGLGCFAIGMLTRVSLGHTGRQLVTSRLTLLAFYSVHIGTLIRVIFPLFLPKYYLTSLHHASGWWTLAFCFYVFEFTKILWTKRPDGK